MLRQSQQQKLSQKLSPQQIQFMKLLQVPTATLEERIKDELENNPALELDKEEGTRDEPYDFEDEGNDKNESELLPDDENADMSLLDNVDISDYLRSDDDMRGGYHSQDDDDDDNDSRSIPAKVENTFHDYLVSQLGMLNLDETDTKIAKQIIGSIDDDGYLRREPDAIVDDLAFNQGINTTLENVERIVQEIKNFDPPGVAAATLQECLLDQALRMNRSDTDVANAIEILEHHFDEFSKKHYDKIKLRLKLSEDDFKDAINVILKLTPKPGSAFATTDNGNFIIPDFFVYNNDGKLELTLNARNAPDLHISDNYVAMQQQYDSAQKKDKRLKEALTFIKQKIDAAKWFIDAIRQRQYTLLVTMNAILEAQKDFFITGDESAIRPMILKTIANKTNMDISTISRVVNSKYVQTEFGVYLLKYFFSEGMTTDSGEEVSTLEVKKILETTISEENKSSPLSDEKLTEILSSKGYSLARRTVAKYREQLNIPVARLRREA